MLYIYIYIYIYIYVYICMYVCLSKKVFLLMVAKLVSLTNVYGFTL